MKSLFTLLLLASTCNSVLSQVHHDNGTMHGDSDDINFTSTATLSSLGSLALLIFIVYLIWHLNKSRGSEPPPKRLQNEDDLTDPNNPRPRQNNRRRRWWYRRNRNYFHPNPSIPQNVVVQPVLHVGINTQDMNPPVGEGMLCNSGTPNVPPPAYSERSDKRAPNSVPQANCAVETNYAYAPNFNQYPPAYNANNPPFASDFRQTNISATAYIEKPNNPRFAPNRY